MNKKKDLKLTDMVNEAIENINSIKERDISVKQGNVINNGVNTVFRLYKMKLEYNKFHNDLGEIDFLED